MTVVVANYELSLICLEIMILWYLDKKTGWVNNRRGRRLVLVVCTSVLLTMQVGLAYDLSSYEQGEIGTSSRGFDRSYERYVDLQPGETRKLGTLSNWNTVTYLEVEVHPSHNNVTFYIIDENRPEVNYTFENLSERVSFLLPYRYTRPYVIANWTANLYNPSETESAIVSVSIQSPWIEDEWFIARRPILLWHTFPSIVLPVLWGYTGLSLLSARLKKSAAPVQISNQPQDVGNTTGQQSQVQT